MYKNITRYINYTRTITQTRYRNITVEVPVIREISLYKNITRYINSTNCIGRDKDSTHEPSSPDFMINGDISMDSRESNSTKCKENSEMNMIFMIGFFITLGLTLFATLVCIWRCWVKEMVEEFIDDLFCCGYGDAIKNCCSCCSILCEICKDEDKDENNERRNRDDDRFNRNEKIEMETYPNPILYPKREGRRIEI